jgi:hypothetical protein
LIIFLIFFQHDHPVVTSRKEEVSKLTKHSFLDKIKNSAKSNVPDNKKRQLNSEKIDNLKDQSNDSTSWNALKDDYMLNPKKVRCLVDPYFVTLKILTRMYSLYFYWQNWDEESSDDEADPEVAYDEDTKELEQDQPRKKILKGGRH